MTLSAPSLLAGLHLGPDPALPRSDPGAGYSGRCGTPAGTGLRGRGSGRAKQATMHPGRAATRWPGFLGGPDANVSRAARLPLTWSDDSIAWRIRDARIRPVEPGDLGRRGLPHVSRGRDEGDPLRHCRRPRRRRGALAADLRRRGNVRVERLRVEGRAPRRAVDGERPLRVLRQRRPAGPDPPLGRTVWHRRGWAPSYGTVGGKPWRRQLRPCSPAMRWWCC